MAFLINTSFDFLLLSVSADTQQDRSGKTVATTQLVRRGRRLGDGRQVHSVSEDDSDAEVKDDPVRQGAARRRTATQRRQTTSATKGGRLGIDKKGRMVRRLKTRRTNEAAQLLLQHGKTRTETAVGSDAVSSIRCGKTTASDFTEKTKDRCGGIKVRHPQGQLAAGAPRRQTDGERSRGPDGTRHRADSDSDGKLQDTGRLAVRQERTMTARGVKAHYLLTGAARRRSKTPTATLRFQWFKTCNVTGTAQKVRRGGEDDGRRPPSEGQAGAGSRGGSNAFIRRISGPRSARYGDGFRRCVRTTALTARERQDGHVIARGEFDSVDIISLFLPYGAEATIKGSQDHGGDAAFSQCVNTRILRSQGPEDTR
ncbi:hypothetical protein A4X09_0g3111 [Tilletia walkeri]|uniref:Uncharacterized protein n=1 Tax=Tilletia walkeri TaxID=117179 RepID=A0A8X7NA37_9BASI|nr:hypothetical protein A4X09_0g3111 [Tilletia walkeri]